MPEIRNTIQHYISVYSGSEKRIISNTKQDCGCSEDVVLLSIKWLLENKYIEIVKLDAMTDNENGYYESDKYTTIYRNKKNFDEIE